MRPQPPRPAAAPRAARSLRALCAAAIVAAAAACAPDSGVLAPEPPDGILEPALFESPECEEARYFARTVLELTGVDPLCVASLEATPLLWREHFAPRFPLSCGCIEVADAGAAP